MKSTLYFIRTTIANGVLVILPLALVVFLLVKAVEYLLILAAPMAHRMPDKVLIFDGSVFVTVAMILFLFFLGGLLSRSQRARGWVANLEDNVLSFLPGYTLIKSVTADALGGNFDHSMKAVLVREDDSYSIGFLVEELDGWCTVWLPETPKQDSGNAIIVPAERIIPLNASSFTLRRSLKSYGKNVMLWHKDNGGKL